MSPANEPVVAQSAPLGAFPPVPQSGFESTRGPAQHSTQATKTRELAPYATDSPQVEATHIDRNVQERAKAMVSVETAVTEVPPELRAFGAEGDSDLASEASAFSRRALPGIGYAMLLRVRFIGGEVPLWGLIAPLIIVGALAAALAASAVSSAPSGAATEEAPSGSGSVVSPGPSGAASARATKSTAGSETKSAAGAAASSASSEGFEVEPGRYSAKEVFGMADQRAQREIGAARAVQAALDRDPGLVEEPRTLSELRRLADNPETARVVLEAIAALPAPVAADLLYEIWTGTVDRTITTDLARALLFSKDVRPKASPALAVALDLRLAKSCEDNQAVLPRAEKQGDRRALHLLIQLQRRYGCGPNKRQDCYPCLRSGDQLENAIKAVRDRREPRSFGKR